MDSPVKENSIVVVTFTSNSPPYNSGDSAGFEKNHARSLIQKKLAVLSSAPFLERVGMTKSKAAEELEAEFSVKPDEKKIGEHAAAESKAEATPPGPPQRGPSPNQGRRGYRR